MKLGGTSTRRVKDIPSGVTSLRKLLLWMGTTWMSAYTLLSLPTNGVCVITAIKAYCPWIDTKFGFASKFTFPSDSESPSTSGAGGRVGGLDLAFFFEEDFLVGMMTSSSLSSSLSSSDEVSSSDEASCSDPSDAEVSESRETKKTQRRRG